MACGTVVVESVKLAGIHLDCTTEPCLSPSLGWLSPTRISFSKDFAAAAPEGADNNIIKATDNMLKGKERSGDRDSMSEFEFAMSIMESENANGKHMLAADELFFKGKLLPLYIPQYIDGSEQQLSQCASLDISDQLEQISARKSSDQKVPTKRSPSSAAVNGGAVTPTVNTKELTQPTSPKTPKCSTKLRELFGLKKTVKPHSSSAAAASSSSCKSSRSSSSKQKAAAILQDKHPLALSKAKRMLCRSDDGSKALEARNSTSEPLLTACVSGGGGGGGEMQLGCPVISFQPHHQAHHQQYKKSQMINVANSSSSCSNACNLARIQRSNRVSDHAEEGSSIRSSQQQQQLLLRVKVRSNENIRSSASRRVVNEEAVCTGLGGSGNGVMRGLTRSLMQGAGSGETSPARRSSGAMSPAGSSGHWSPGRHSAGALMSGWGSPGRRHSGARYSPGRLSLGESSCMEAAGHGRLMRARSLERSSSYSPKSLQRRYDQLKAMRQREGWRSLERSSSYNNNMNSVRVAPVLNVPVVCIRSSKNSSNSSSSGGGGGGGGGFGLGHLNLFSTKNSSSNNYYYINGGNSSKLDHSRTPSSKVLQQPIKVLPSRRPPPPSITSL